MNKGVSNRVIDLMIISTNPVFKEIFTTQTGSNQGSFLRISNFSEIPDHLPEMGEIITFVDLSVYRNGSLDTILQIAHTIPVVLIKNQFEPREVFSFLRFGIRGITSIEEGAVGFNEIINTVLNGGIYLDNEAFRNLFRFLQATLSTDSLSARESEVLSKILNGATYKEIGIVLDISYETVRTHAKNIFKKLNVHRKSDLLKYELIN